MKGIKKALGLGLAVAALGVLAACGSGAAGAEEETTTVSIGLTAANITHWELVRDNLAEEGINLELVQFTDWVTPNTALAHGDIDLNAFQTISFLDNFNLENDEDLVPIGNTIIMPMGIFSDRIEDLADLPDGATVSIANDPTNGGRGLLLLQSAGLITVDPAAGWQPAIQDIIDNPHNINIVELEAQQLARSLQDVDIAVINGVLALEAGIHPNTDSIFLEPVDLESPFVNVIATRSENANNPAFQAVVDAFQTREVAELILEVFDNTQFPVFDY
jgi:D-methionine transport system substrate-binding protein